MYNKICAIEAGELIQCMNSGLEILGKREMTDKYMKSTLLNQRFILDEIFYRNASKLHFFIVFNQPTVPMCVPQSCGNLGISSFIHVEGKNLPFDHDFTTNVTWDNEENFEGFWSGNDVMLLINKKLTPGIHHHPSQ